MQLGRKLGVALALLTGVAMHNSAWAESDEWQFEVTPYLFAAGMDGTVGVRGYEADMDVSFSDLLDNLEMGFMGLFTAQKGPWTLGLEAVYMELESGGDFDITGPGGIIHTDGKLDVTSSMFIAQGSVGYRLLDDATKLDVIGGLRYTKLDVDLEVRRYSPPPFSGKRSEDGSKEWVDAVVGLRVQHPLTDNLTLLGYADVGGGGSDLTYQAIAGVNWEFAEDYTAKLGYRLMYWDYEDDGVVWDVTASGLYLGLGIRF